MGWRVAESLPLPLSQRSLLLLSVAGVALLAHVWLILAIIHDFSKSIFLLVCCCLFWAYLAYPHVEKRVPKGLLDPVNRWIDSRAWFTPAAYIVSLVALLVFVVANAYDSTAKLSSLGSLILIIIIAVLVSDNPGRIKWRPVVWGLILQYIVALLILRWKAGRSSIQFVTEQIVTFLGYTGNGTSVIFGYIPNPPGICGMDGPFSFTSLPIIIFFSALCSAAYYLGFVQWLLRKSAVLLQWTMGTTSAESLNAVASIFLGPTEGAVLMKFSLATMTASETVASMAVGFAMISGSLFAIYISFGACPALLLSANVMSAPAVLAVSKIVSPEVQKSRQKDMRSFVFPPSEEKSVMEALRKGSYQAVWVVFAIIANLVVFLGLISFIDVSIGYLADLVGYENVGFNTLMGYAFFPVALAMGASDKEDWDEKVAETLKVAQLIGSKTVLNEFIAYQQMQGMLIRKEIGARAQMIAVYALCGYSNASQIGSQLGIFGAMCPKNKKIYAVAATKGLIIGSLACFMTACVAGSLIGDDMGCMPANSADTCVQIG